MKAILVIDMPKKCYDCQLMTDNMYCKGFTPYYTKDGTHITKMCVEDYVMHGDKHPNCPLKPMPKRMLTLAKMSNGEILNNNEIQYMKGRNDCIDEILGEEE